VRASIEANFKHKIYLPLIAKNVPPTALVDEASALSTMMPISQLIRQIAGTAQGGDAASAQIAAVNRKSRVVRNLLRTLLHSFEPLLLLGDPGTGKTMTLQQVVLSLAESEGRRVFPLVPVYVRLGEFHVAGPVGQRQVLDYVSRSVHNTSIQRRLHSLDHAKRLVILFDGIDEMSRDRYNEHTEALSLFAGARQGRVKTLFSCRITDFSPKFVHRRLVLLPFSREQIKEYLRKYLQAFPVTIDGKPWSVGQLAKYLARGGLPMDATNPFVLWLLCFHLLRTKTWPGSRVDLLRFYIEETYRRKSAELSREQSPFPAPALALSAWARFGYAITERNRGATIPLRDLIAITSPGEDVPALARLGALCGVLSESANELGPCIRFEHHRFQEYFTALHLSQVSPEIHWLDKLDAPRWQETMLNLVLMGGADEGVEQLVQSIDTLAGAFENAKAPDSTRISIERVLEKASESKVAESGAPPELDAEIILSDRVELASRIVRQCGHGRPSIRTDIGPTIKYAISRLAERGNPITQVKMIRACQNLPDVDLVGALRAPLASSINWVRNEALVLIAEGRSSAGALGSDLATEIGYDLADGLFPARIPTYLKAAHASSRRDLWQSLAIGLTCQAALTTLLFALVAVVYFVARLLFPPLGAAFVIPIYFGLTLSAYAISIASAPRLAQLATLGICSLSIATLGFVMACAGTVVPGRIISSLCLCWGCYIGMCVILRVAAALLHFTIVGAYLIAHLRVRSVNRANRSFFQVVWRNYSGADTADRRNGILFSLLGIEVRWMFKMLVYGVGGAFLLGLFKQRWSIWNNAGSAGFALGVGLLLATVVGLFITLRLSRFAKSEIAKRRYSGAITVFYGLSIIAGVSIAIAVVDATLVKVDRWAFAIQLARGLSVFLVLVLSSIIVYLVAPILRMVYATILLSRLPYPAGSFQKHEWIDLIKNSRPSEQKIELLRTNHQSLGLTAPEYFDVLEEIEDLIKKEPASTVYWRQRDELLQVIKQERQG
jgi:NACHT domain